MASISSWSDLPQDLLRVLIAGLTSPADCACFRAVCRSWRLIPSPFRIPWVALPERLLMRCRGHFSADCFPENNHCVGTTDDWLAMDSIDAQTRTHTYSLENFFSKTTMPLPELDKIIGNTPELFQVRKVLMKSPPVGLIALRTNSCDYPIILVQPGKGVWYPEPQTTMLTRITDIAFLQDKLYGITHEEDLISLSLAVDSHGAPTVTSIDCVINHLDDDDSDVSSDVDNEDKDDEAEAENIDYEDEGSDWMVSDGDKTDDGYGTACDGDFEGEDEDGDGNTIDNRGYISEEEEEKHVVEQQYIGNDGMVMELDDKEPYKDLILTIWYLVESRGKLLMVRRQLQRPDHITCFTRRVEVFEADTNTSTWVPMSSGLDGHALLISKRFSKSVSGGGEVENDAIYFIDTGEVFNMRSKTSTPPNMIAKYEASCLFIPGSF